MIAINLLKPKWSDWYNVVLHLEIPTPAKSPQKALDRAIIQIQKPGLLLNEFSLTHWAVYKNKITATAYPTALPAAKAPKHHDGR